MYETYQRQTWCLLVSLLFPNKLPNKGGRMDLWSRDQNMNISSNKKLYKINLQFSLNVHITSGKNVIFRDVSSGLISPTNTPV